MWGAARMVQAVAPGNTRTLSRRDRERDIARRTRGRAVERLLLGEQVGARGAERGDGIGAPPLGHSVIVIEPGFIDTPILQKENDFGMTAPPYDELARIWEAAEQQALRRRRAPGPELVAGAIADALEEDQPLLRHPVGADAEMVVRGAIRWATSSSSRRCARCSGSTGNRLVD